MRIQNTTNIATQRLKEIIGFAKPKNLPTSKFKVRVTNSSKIFCGKFRGSQIIARVTPHESKFPYFVDRSPQERRPWRKFSLYFDNFNEKTKEWEEGWHCTMSYQSIKDKLKLMSSGGYISELLLSREEALVSVLAHELRHLWQSNHPKCRGRVWGARGQYSDRDADAYAIRKVREWRRAHNPLQIFPDDVMLTPDLTRSK